MDGRAAKLALARKKLKDHQDRKLGTSYKDDMPQKLPVQHDTHCDNECSADIGKQLASVSNVIAENNQDLVFSSELDENNASDNVQSHIEHLNATEILITNKRNLEIQVNELQVKLAELENNYLLSIEKYNASHQKVLDLERDLRIANENYLKVTNDLLQKDEVITELNAQKSKLTEENNTILEQLDFTKTMLTSKQSENNSLYSQLFNLQNELEAAQLQIQQLTNGTCSISFGNEQITLNENSPLMQKIIDLEQQLKEVHKEKETITSYYQQYTNDTDEQLKGVIKKNQEQHKVIETLAEREYSLINQVAEMERIIQNLNKLKDFSQVGKTNISDDFKELKYKYHNLQENYNDNLIKYEKLQKQYAEVIELSQSKQANCQHETISMSKLNADIASDKIAVQRATEQNKKLKQDLQGLEDAFIKMSKDKLELTEMLTVEKDLSKKLSLTLADVEEKVKDLQKQLKAKDEEMIRLQSNNRNIEREYERLLHDRIDNNKLDDNNINEIKVLENYKSNENNIELTNNNHDEEVTIKEPNTQCDCNIETNDAKKNVYIPKEDAMEKLQKRFLKIMEEVADLSDEKHRLEHIILQLQNETETICEYVALYQQQRSLLKKRDEERSAQIKLFEDECNKLRTQLEELTGILLRLANDKDLSLYFEAESRRNDIQRIASLLSNLKNNSLVDPNKNVDFKNFNPCNCCSGKLIEI